METKQIKVGDYIRGFKVEHTAFELDDKYIGLIAKVIIVSNDGTIKVEYSDGTTWWYYTHQAIEHLCNDDMKDFEKGLDANSKDSMKDNINPDHYKSKSKETI